MKKTPSLRVTKWLADIPIEGCCTLCPTGVFRASSDHHRPNTVEYREKLQRAFDRHVKDLHSTSADIEIEEAGSAKADPSS